MSGLGRSKDRQSVSPSEGLCSPSEFAFRSWVEARDSIIRCCLFDSWNNGGYTSAPKMGGGHHNISGQEYFVLKLLQVFSGTSWV